MMPGHATSARLPEHNILYANFQSELVATQRKSKFKKNIFERAAGEEIMNGSLGPSVGKFYLASV